MTEDPYSPRPLAPWFKWAAWGSLLFMAFGCASYLMKMTADRSAQTVDQQAMLAAVPTWMWAAFAIAVHTDPDIFVIDEALAVGDGYFMWKCMKKLEEMKAKQA